jgi:DNA polymerase-3 subunit beta
MAHITLRKAEFAQAIDNLTRNIPDSYPEAGLVELELNGGLHLRVAHDRHIEYSLPLAEPVGTGLVYVHGPKLVEVVRQLPAGDLSLSLGDTALILQTGTYTAQITLAQPEKFPGSAFCAEGAIQIPAQELCEALEAVKYAVAKEEHRRVFLGIQLELGPTLKAVATDGFRLAICEMPLKVQAEPVKIVLPKVAVQDIIRLFEESTDALQFAVKKNQVSVSSSQARLSFTVMQDTFPDYQRVVPKEYISTITLNAASLEAALRRIELVASSINHRVDLSFQDSALLLETQGDLGTAREVIETSGIEGEPVKLSFNARLLREALPRAGHAQLALSGNATPTKIGSLEDSRVYGILAPLRFT